MAGGIGVLVGVLALGSWFAFGPTQTEEVRLESIAAPTEVIPENSGQLEVLEPPHMPDLTGRPNARLLLSTGDDLQITDIDGVQMEVPPWQPTPDAGPVSDVAVQPDGTAVVVWHRGCLLEAGSLIDGRDLVIPHVVDGVPTTDGCSGPAVFSPDGTAIAWTSGVDGQDQIYAAAWTREGVNLATCRLTWSR